MCVCVNVHDYSTDIWFQISKHSMQSKMATAGSRITVATSLPQSNAEAFADAAIQTCIKVARSVLCL